MVKSKQIKKPSLNQMIKMADKFWEEHGHMTLFPSKDSYIAYVKDTHKQIKAMSSLEYKQYLSMTNQFHIERLKRLEQSLISKRQGTK